MVTAEAARKLMPNVTGILSKIENNIKTNASQGFTKVSIHFTKKEAKQLHLVKSTLVNHGYTISEDMQSLTISWKKI